VQRQLLPDLSFLWPLPGKIIPGINHCSQLAGASWTFFKGALVPGLYSWCFDSLLPGKYRLERDFPKM